MDSPVQVPTNETTPFWTNEKHLHFLNTMEASFVRTMFQNKGCFNHNRNFLRLDRLLPDSSESTLDLKLKPHNHNRRRTRKHRAPSDVMGLTTRITTRRTRRRSSQPSNSSLDQVVPQAENESKGAACYGGDADEVAEN